MSDDKNALTGVQVQNAEGKMVDLTVNQLEQLAANTGRVTEVVIHSDRNLNKGNFENEKYGQSTKINFDCFWSMISDEALRSPKVAPVLQKAFANGAFVAIGVALRDIYINHVYSCFHRAEQLKLPQLKILQAEKDLADKKLGFNPFGVHSHRDED
jgi:hypothetical protein